MKKEVELTSLLLRPPLLYGQTFTKKKNLPNPLVKTGKDAQFPAVGQDLFGPEEVCVLGVVGVVIFAGGFQE